MAMEMDIEQDKLRQFYGHLERFNDVLRITIGAHNNTSRICTEFK